jgi:hypothetical protein
LCATLASACGESGSRETRPAEVMFRVARPSGAKFRVAAIQAANALHLFEDKEFKTAHIFVLEDPYQPVTGIFQNTDPTLPITVEMSIGTQLVSSQEIQPGICCTVGSGRTCDQATATCDAPTSTPGGDEVRIEVVSLSPSANVGFSASIGDNEATNITACVIGADICRTPATFFMEDPVDSVSAVITKAAGENNDIELNAQLFVNGDLKDQASGRGTIVVKHDL